MKMLLAVFLPLILFAFVAGIKISFKPFKIVFTDGWFAIGLLLVTIGITICRYQDRVKSHKNGFEAGVDFTIETIKQLSEQKTIEK